MKIKSLHLFTFILLLSVSFACSSKSLVLKQKEKEKLIEGRWGNSYGYVDFQFIRKGKANEYKIMWPGSRLDVGTWRIANNGIILKSKMEGIEIYGDVVKLDENNFTVYFENREEYELQRIDEKKKK